MIYQYAILECENVGHPTLEEQWKLNYCDSDDFVLVENFGMVKINLFAGIRFAEELGWELIQIFPDRTTQMLSYGYAIMRKGIEE